MSEKRPRCVTSPGPLQFSIRARRLGEITVDAHTCGTGGPTKSVTRWTSRSARGKIDGIRVVGNDLLGAREFDEALSVKR
jgi:hypothetical protein